MHYRIARALVILACALLFPLQAAAISSSSPNFSNSRSSVDMAGRRKTSTNYRADAEVGGVCVPGATSTNFHDRDGLEGFVFYPGRVTNVFGSSGTVPGTAYLQWTSPGNDGYESSSAGAYVVRYSSIASQSPASSDALFYAGTNISPAPPAPSVDGTLQNTTATGLLQGVTYYFAMKTAERDGVRSPLSVGTTIQTPTAAGCAIVRDVDSVNGPYTTIQSAVNALPNPLQGFECVIIQNGANYPEQVTVANFTMNGSSIAIFADPATGLTPSVTPPTGFAAFSITNASVTLAGINIVPTSAINYGVFVSSAYVKISSVNVQDASFISVAGIVTSSWTTVSYTSVTVSGANASAFWLPGSTMTTVSYSSGSASNTLASSGTLTMVGASSNTITGSYFYSAVSHNDVFMLNSNFNTIIQSTMTGGKPALYLSGSSSNSITGSYVYSSVAVGIAAEINGGTNNTISQSTITESGAGGSSGLELLYSFSNQISSSSLTGTGTGGAGLYLIDSNYNAISQSTMTGAGSAYGLIFNGASSNTIAGSYMTPEANIFNQSNGNTISQSTMTSSTAFQPLYLQTSSSNTIQSSYMASLGGYAAYLSNDNFTTIAGSTMTSSVSSALYLFQSSVTLIMNDYVQGSTAVSVNQSTITVIGGSVLIATNTFGSALQMDGGSVDLALSSSVLTSQASGAAVYLAPGDNGAIFLSTNVFAGAEYGVFVATPVAGAQLWITSNTIVSTASIANNTYGLYFDGLASGATVENNTVVERTPGSMFGFTAYGLYSLTSFGMQIDHNRFDEPGMITLGSYVGAYFAGTTNSAFKFNDMNSTGTGFTNAYLIEATNFSNNLLEKDNVLMSSWTVSGSSATVLVDATSKNGFSSDYNDYFSSNTTPAVFSWNGSVAYGLLGWQAASGQDLNSIAGNPLWENVVSGVEDFHPMSTVGRYLMGGGGPVTDQAQSPTIDTGDPLEAWALEPGQNGGIVNQGSYGDTTQASQSQPGYATCAVTKRVGAGQTFPKIQQAVSDLPASLPAGKSCVIIEDNGTYNEQVTVQNFTMNLSSIAIFADVGFSPTVNPPAASTAAFVIKNASVTVMGINIVPTSAMTYGVYISSAYVSLSSVNVQDASARISAAGVVASSWTTVNFTSVTVGGAGAYGFWLPGSTMTTVSKSSAAATNAGGSGYALYLNNASSNTFTVFLASSPSNVAALLDSHSNNNSISQSTFTTGAAAAALDIYGATNTVTLSVMTGYRAIGTHLEVGASSNTITYSSMSTGGYAALQIDSSSNTIAWNSFLSTAAAHGHGVELTSTAMFNFVTHSTITASPGDPGGLYGALQFDGAPYNTALYDIVHSYAGNTIIIGQNSYGDTVQYSSASVVSGAAHSTFYVWGSSGNLVDSDYIGFWSGGASGNDALYVDINSSSNTFSNLRIEHDGDSLGAVEMDGSYSAFTNDLVTAYNTDAFSIGEFQGPAIAVTITGSTITQQGGSYNDALFVGNATGTVVTGSVLSALASGGGLEVVGGSYKTVVRWSTMTGTGFGQTWNGGAVIGQGGTASALNTTIMDSYLVGSPALQVFGATNTVVGDSTLVGSAAGYGSVFMGGNAMGLTISTSAMSAPAGVNAATVYIATASAGLIVLSSNTVLSSAEYAVEVATQAAGAQIFITSNTIVPAISNAYNTYGVFLNGLATGATIQNNTIVYQTAAADTGFTAYGFFAQTTAGVDFDHNRVVNPGSISGGAYYAAYLSNATNTTFKFNDVYSTAPAMAATLLRAGENSANLSLRDNIFFSSFPAPGGALSTGTVVFADANSENGLSANYNDYFSSNALIGFQWGATAGPQSLAAWRTATSQEGASKSVNPDYVNAVSGALDMHPMSTIGTWNAPTNNLINVYGVESPTIDGGDPTEGVGLEPSPNGNVANQGSYGLTAQASESLTNYPGCAVTEFVGSGQTYPTISLGVAALPATLPLGMSCVVIEDNGIYAEQVTVANFNPSVNISSIAIFAAPTFAPTVNPPAGNAAFVITNASVSLSGISITPTHAINYGVFVSSGYVTISSVNVQDAGSKISVAGIVASSWTTVSYTSVTVAAAGASAFWLPGSTMTSVSYSSAQANGGSGYALWLNGASSNTFNVFLASNPAGTGVYLDAHSNYNRIFSSTMTGNSAYALYLNGASSNTITTSYITNPAGTAAYLTGSANYNAISLSTMNSHAGGGDALYLNGASFNTINGDVVSNPSGLGAFLNANSSSNTLSLSTFTSNAGGVAGLYLLASSSNMVTGDYVSNPSGNALWLDPNSDFNNVSLSTITSAIAGSNGLYLNGASSNTFTGDVVFNLLGNAGEFAAGANGNKVSLSSFTSDASGYAGLYLSNASSNAIAGIYVINPLGNGLWLDPYSDYNSVIQSTMSSGAAGSSALYLNGASSNTLSADNVFNAAGNAGYLNAGADGNFVSLSTFTSNASGYFALYILTSSSNTVASSYMLGATAVDASHSTGTVIGGSVLIATNTTGNAMQLDGGSVNLTLSSSTLTAPASGAAVFMGIGDAGWIFLSTNAMSGAAYGVYVATPVAGTQLWITSNTIVSTMSVTNNVYGLYFDALASGATVENNTVVWRTPGSMNGFVAYGLYAQSSFGMQVDHNRFDDPGMITLGSFVGADFVGTTNSAFKFNDVNSTGTALTNAYMIEATNFTSNILVKDNVLLSSWTVSGSSATVLVDAHSLTGFAADYNDYFSSNTTPAVFSWNGSIVYGLIGWQTASLQDLNSISGNPLWENVVSGVEDFHPMSTVGRYLMGGGGPVTDQAQSPTIDTGDPLELFNLEPGQNGGIVNQGSYGDTTQASQSQAGYATCAITKRVGAGQTFPKIQQAVNDLPASLPAGKSCVIIEDNATYNEQVTVQNFTMNLSSIAIFADVGFTPTVNPPAGNAAFVIMNASVAVLGINIAPSNAINYGVFISSAYVQISSVNVKDQGGSISVAGIVASSWTTISYTSVTVGGLNASGFYLPGSTMTSVSNSSATATNSSGTGYAVWLNGASSNTITSFNANDVNANTFYLGPRSNANTISFSTITANVFNARALDLLGSSSNTITSDFIYNSVGHAAYLDLNSNGNAISHSTMTSGSGYDALYLAGASSNTITTSFMNSVSGSGLYLYATGVPYSNFNSISLSTMIGGSGAYGLYINDGTSNTVVNSYMAAPAGAAAYLFGSNDNAISGSTMVSNTSGYQALYISNGIGNSVTGSVVSNPLGTGALLTINNSYNVISFSTMTSGASGYYGLEIAGANSLDNSVAMSYVANTAGVALYLSNTSTTTLGGLTVVGSTAAWVSQSTGTVIGMSALTATSAGGSALQMDGGSINLSLSSSVLTAPTSGAAVYLGPGDAGWLVFSTNTLTGAEYGVFVATPIAGTQLWITSNTVVSTMTTSNNVYGLYFDGLASGATVENNAVVFRTGGSMGAFTAYGLYSLSSVHMQIDHNRIDNPGMVTVGSFIGADFLGTQTSAFKFNDVNATAASALTGAYLLEATNFSTNMVVKDNIFSSSFTAPGASNSSGTMVVDGNSNATFASDYNDYYSSNAWLGFSWGGVGAQGLTTSVVGWQTISGKDAHSISLLPLWYNTASGVEDFHPMSVTGRWNQALGNLSFTDNAQSPTIDAGDPAEGVGSEQSPNGGLADQGSYGLTLQASESAGVPTAFAITTTWVSSVTTTFTAPVPPANGYVVQASTVANFSDVLFSSDTITGALQLAPQGLDPNTTYYLRAGSLWGTTTIYASTVLSTSTLSSLVSGTTVYQINVTSMVFNWLPFTLSPPSSMSAEGYILQASISPTFSPVLSSSFTANVLGSTLTVGGFTGGVTYYFRVGTYNWNSVVNYQTYVSTLMPVQLGVMTTSTTIPISATQAMGTTVVISTSVTLTNTGNVSETYTLRVTTTSAGSKWQVGSSPWQDRYSAWAVVNSTVPASADFPAVTSQLADPYTSCSPSNFTMGNSNGVQVPVGATRLIWVKIAMPLTTSDATLSSQNIQFTALPVKDP